ncbi:hypothetical protein [Mesorhizobium sp. KR1-2]|uniref:hypothetical protein n=1 Tax=Mesorhizobium sp. KR1-2 TaxID=3156609 RepID=UPI0032B601CF
MLTSVDMTSLPHIRTTDGTVLVRDPQTGRVVSGRSLDDAVTRLSRVHPAHTHEHAHVHEEKPS